MTFLALARGVRAHLGQDRRYEHSVRVARYADILAQIHGLDTHKARTAGLLHDLARLYGADRLIAECTARRLPIDAFERAHPMLLHARLGAVIAHEKFGVRDPDVLSAIEKHTAGAGSMSALDCAVYLADGLEPARSFAERARLWELAKRDMSLAMRGVLLESIRHLARKGRRIAPQTAAAARTFGLEPVAIEEVYASAI
ncbi:MAG: bis(5'-nucleosyl)-tetraphosphatase (symmetrical) YqeK [Candidatus Eremiobacteraeota bacterium]|nr:bis(5'-nucleosyl)-tetraphosphatase (symmetrical) YqeK [Candidatus Eremiobacteraeota bacterium]